MTQTVLLPYVTTGVAEALNSLPARLEVIETRYGQTVGRITADWWVLVGPDNEDPCDWVKHVAVGAWWCDFETVSGQLVTHMYRVVP